ncbi:MAG: oligosaccharide flippase family protein [Anaerolineae bacterium]
MKRRADVLALILLAILPFLFFWPVVFGGKTLVPVDNLFAWEPWRSLAQDYRVGAAYNELLSDLILENYAWKTFLRQSIAAGELPLWNPYLFTGVPFLAAGQHSALYPFSLIFYVMPLSRAYGIFSALQLALAGVGMYLFLRAIGARPAGAFLGGVTYAFSSFMVVSVAFTMMIAAAAWLPWLLLALEMVVRRSAREPNPPALLHCVQASPLRACPEHHEGAQARRGRLFPTREGEAELPPFVGEGLGERLTPLPSQGRGWGRGNLRDGAPWLVAGAIFLGLQVLAGHIEITYYVLLIMAFYAAVRLSQMWWRSRSLPWRPALLILGMIAFGLGSAAVQLLPLFELAQSNFRSGAAAYRVTYQDVIGWAYPWRQLATFVIPDLYGNPSIHRYFDIASLRWLPITHNALGEAMDQVAWGKGLPSWKNYVEAGSYLGILPLLLAPVATFSRRFRRYSLIFAALALVSLLFVFGTPLYRLLFLLPGINQLHSPFRWVFPYTFSLAVLAGLGVTDLTLQSPFVRLRAGPSPKGMGEYPCPGKGGAGGEVLARLAMLAGGLALLGLLAVLVYPGPFIALAERVLAVSELSQRAFSDGRMLLSYQYRNLLLFAAALCGSGLAMLAMQRRWTWGRLSLWQPLAALVLVGDLFAVGYGFNPRADPALLDVKPPVIEFLQRDEGPWRFTTFIAPGEKPLNANAGMLYGFEDVRGYDSIIPRQYVDFMELIEPQDELLYNRIAPLSEASSLDSPLLDLLNVKYVVTSQEIGNRNYKLVFEGALRVYQNEDCLPRAFALTIAKRVPPGQLADALRAADPRAAVILEERANPPSPPSLRSGQAFLTSEGGKEAPLPEAGRGGMEGLLPVDILLRGQNEVLLLATLPEPAWVVLTDAYFPGWRAYVRPAGSSDEEQQVAIERAYGAFRAVYLPAGSWELRFYYMPRSFQIGLYTSFISGVALLLIAAAWLWTRYYHQDDEEPTVRRVAKNSLTPMTLSLVNKLIDMAFAMLMLRILAPEGAGRYQFAVTFIGYFEILVRFGLGTLLTREVARSPGQGPRYLGNALALRGLLWLASLPLMALLLLGYVMWSGLTADVVAAIALFAVATFLGNVADGFSSIFYARERMELPAFISTGTTLTRVALGAAVLLLGGGFVGLAAISIVSNLFTVAALGLLLARDYFRPRLAFDRGFATGMVRESFPLMINHLLATVFFQVDVLLLKPMRGDIEVGYYSAAYRYIRGLDIIPSYFTMALFPVMARYAQSAQDSLQRAYRLSLRLLFLVSLPLAMGTTFIARELILVLAGPEYLPQSQWALQILIWFMPLGFVNSVTQYVLIALDEQRYLSRAFVIGVSFNLVANLITIPLYGYLAAAVVTVLSELALLVPFMHRLYRHMAPVSWLDLIWRPALATAVMGLAMLGMRAASAHVLTIIPVAVAVYATALLATGIRRAEDMSLVLGLLGRRFAGQRPVAN